MNPQNGAVETAVAVVDNGATMVDLIREPSVVLQEAVRAAKALQDVIDKNKKKPVIINGKKFPEFEDWQTLARFYGYSVILHDALPVEIFGIKGFKAKADVVDQNGIVVGGAEGFCMQDEEKWEKKSFFQMASMAQTRAGAKAFRAKLSWVIILAGYSPTPAEEMDGKMGTRDKPDPDEEFQRKFNGKPWKDIPQKAVAWAASNSKNKDRRSDALAELKLRANAEKVQPTSDQATVQTDDTKDAALTNGTSASPQVHAQPAEQLPMTDAQKAEAVEIEAFENHIEQMIKDESVWASCPNQRDALKKLFDNAVGIKFKKIAYETLLNSYNQKKHKKAA